MSSVRDDFLNETPTTHTPMRLSLCFLLLAAQLGFSHSSLAQSELMSLQGPPGGWINDIVIDQDGTFFAATSGSSSGDLYRSTDEGTTWTRLPIPESEIRRLAVTSDRTLYAATNRSGAIPVYNLYRSTDSGATWNLAFPDPADSTNAGTTVMDVVVSTRDDVFLSIANVGIFRSEDAGATWTVMNQGLDSLNVVVLDVTPDGSLLAGTSSAIVYEWHSASMQWQVLFTGDTSNSNRIVDMVKRADGALFIATSQDGIHRSLDGGVQWTRLDTNRSIALLEEGPDGVLYHDNVNAAALAQSLDNGDTWQPVNQGLSFTAAGSTTTYGVRALAFSESQYVAGTSGNGGVFRTSDPETGWTQTTLPAARLLDITTTDAPSIWAATDGAGLFRWDPATMAWEKNVQTLPGGSDNGSLINFIESAPDGTLFVSDFIAKQVFRSTDDGTTWTLIFAPGTPLPGISDWANRLAFVEDRIYMSTGTGYLLGSTDNGNTWSVLSETVRQSFIESDALGDLYAGGMGAGLYRSTDQGTTWEHLTEGLPESSLSNVEITPAGHLFAYISGSISRRRGGSMFRSLDQGATWTPVMLPIQEDEAITAVYAMDDESLIVTTLNNLYASTDDGETWITPIDNWPGLEVRAMDETQDGDLLLGALFGGVFLIEAPTLTHVDSGQPVGEDIPHPITLHPAYPNPFHTQTTLSFTLTEPQTVNLAVYDVLGRRVTVLIDADYRGAGVHTVSFDAGTLPSGTYFYQFQAGATRVVRSALVLK